MFHQYFGFLIIFGAFWTSANGDYFEECKDVDATYAVVQEDCTFYIFCHGEESFKDSCPEDSPYFSIEDHTCDTNRNVCGNRPSSGGNFSGEEVEVTTETVNNSTTNPTTTSSTKSSLISTIASTTSTPNAQTSTTSSLIPTMSTAFIPALLPSSCPIVDNPKKVIFLPHSKSCSEYFLCYHGERLPMHCSNMLHFDVRQQKCDYAEKVKCHLMDLVSPREQCSPRTFDFYPHPRNCNYYYQCLLGYLKVMQCPLNMDWHYKKRACVLRSQAKCYNSSARFVI